jgi:hypothetical protein
MLTIIVCVEWFACVCVMHKSNELWRQPVIKIGSFNYSYGLFLVPATLEKKVKRSCCLLQSIQIQFTISFKRKYVHIYFLKSYTCASQGLQFSILDMMHMLKNLKVIKKTHTRMHWHLYANTWICVQTWTQQYTYI